MLVIALCTTCFSSAKINKKRWPPYFKIWPLQHRMLWRRHWLEHQTFDCQRGQWSSSF